VGENPKLIRLSRGKKNGGGVGAEIGVDLEVSSFPFSRFFDVGFFFIIHYAFLFLKNILDTGK